MENRTAAVIITILAVLLCACPGLAAFCLGLASAFDYAAGLGIFASDQRTYLSWIFGGGCIGLFLILVAAVIIFLVLRNPKAKTPPATPLPPNEPLPPTI